MVYNPPDQISHNNIREVLLIDQFMQYLPAPLQLPQHGTIVPLACALQHAVLVIGEANCNCPYVMSW